MKVTTLIHCHKFLGIQDTIKFVQKNMSKDILLLVDGAGWKEFDKEQLPVPVLKGFNHGYYKAPYRNVILGLIHAYKNWPDSDWIAYLEYDTIVSSSDFFIDLKKANDDGVWLVGSDYRDKQNFQGIKSVNLPLIEAILKEEIKEIHYFLGAVQFFHKDFMKKLMENDFLEKLLYYTNDFQKDFFPGYSNTSPAAWDCSEHIYPTLAIHWGGRIQQLSKWDDKKLVWSGNYKR